MYKVEDFVIAKVSGLLPAASECLNYVLRHANAHWDHCPILVQSSPQLIALHSSFSQLALPAAQFQCWLLPDTMTPNRYVHIQIQTYDGVYTLSIQCSIPTPLPETSQPNDQTRLPSRTHR